MCGVLFRIFQILILRQNEISMLQFCEITRCRRCPRYCPRKIPSKVNPYNVVGPSENLKTGTIPYVLLTISDPRGGVLTLADPQGVTSGDFLYRGNLRERCLHEGYLAHHMLEPSSDTMAAF